MRVSTKFTMAVHLLACVVSFDGKVTSEFMAGSIGTNPVVVRQLLQKLKAAGLVEVTRGTGGVRMARSAGDVTLLDVYRAVESEQGLFGFHPNPNPKCPVGRSIHRALDDRLEAAQRAFERELAATKLADVLADIPQGLPLPASPDSTPNP